MQNQCSSFICLQLIDIVVKSHEKILQVAIVKEYLSDSLEINFEFSNNYADMEVMVCF